MQYIYLPVISGSIICSNLRQRAPTVLRELSPLTFIALTYYKGISGKIVFDRTDAD